MPPRKPAPLPPSERPITDQEAERIARDVATRIQRQSEAGFEASIGGGSLLLRWSSYASIWRLPDGKCQLVYGGQVYDLKDS